MKPGLISFLSLVPGTGQVPHCMFMKWICWGKIILATWFHYFWRWRKLAPLGIGELAVSTAVKFSDCAMTFLWCCVQSTSGLQGTCLNVWLRLKSKLYNLLPQPFPGAKSRASHLKGRMQGAERSHSWSWGRGSWSPGLFVVPDDGGQWNWLICQWGHSWYQDPK